MIKYFRLFEECILVDGANSEYAIYNLLTGDVFQLKKHETEIISLCENKMSINNIIEKLNFCNKEIINFLDKLVDADLGFYSENPVYIEKMFMDYSWLDLTFLKERPVVNKSFLILESNCTSNCYYCNKEYTRKKGCVGCFKQENIKNTTTLEEYFFALDKLKKLGTKEIYITGGDIFLNFERNMEVLKYANNLGFEKIVVYIGGNRKIDDNKLEFFRENKIHLFLQVAINSEYDLKENKLLKSKLQKFRVM